MTGIGTTPRLLAATVLGLALWFPATRVASAQEDCPRAMLPAYSHNDYEQARPLKDALALGFRGVEADLFLINGVLRVGHDRRSASRGGSLETVYLMPLDSLARRCTQLTVDEQPYLLLLELKEPGRAARDSLVATLQRYPRLGATDSRAPVEVIFVGPHRPALRASGGGELDLHRDVGTASALEPARSAAHRGARLLSLNYGEAIGSRWISGRERQRRLEALAGIRHGAPAVPLRVHNLAPDSATYSSLLIAGVDLIGTKRLAATSRLLLTIAVPEAGAQSTSKCKPADWRSGAIISHLKYQISATDPRDIRLRDSVYRVPVVPLSRITVVTDERICAKLVEAYSRGPSGWVPVNLYVIQLGDNHYAVMDPERKAGEFSTVLIYDSKYVRVGGWTGP